MKFGHFVGLILLGLALVSGLYAWWDWQDGSTNSMVTGLPVFTGVMALAFLLFPGAPLAPQPEAPDATAPIRVGGDELDDTPLTHKRAWLAAFLLSIYLSMWLNNYLQGKDFFTFGTQLIIAFLAVAGYLFLRRTARRQDL